MDIRSSHVVIFGGSAGMGRGVARHAIANGATRVSLIGRNQSKLDSVRTELLDRPSVEDHQQVAVDLHAVDCSDGDALSLLANTFEERSVSHVVVTFGGLAGGGSFESLSMETLKRQFELKFFAQAAVANAMNTKLLDGGSLTFFSGTLSRRPGKGAAALASANAAVETLTVAVANDLGPRVRVNCISPGLTRDTDVFGTMPKEGKEAMFNRWGASLPLGRAATPDDIGQAAVGLMAHPYMTGVILPVDGGAVIRP